MKSCIAKSILCIDVQQVCPVELQYSSSLSVHTRTRSIKMARSSIARRGLYCTQSWIVGSDGSLKWEFTITVDFSGHTFPGRRHPKITSNENYKVVLFVYIFTFWKACQYLSKACSLLRLRVSMAVWRDCDSFWNGCQTSSRMLYNTCRVLLFSKSLNVSYRNRLISYFLREFYAFPFFTDFIHRTKGYVMEITLIKSVDVRVIVPMIVFFMAIISVKAIIF